MNDQRKHLKHVMLHCFKQHKSANDTTNKICIVYGYGAISIPTVHTWFRKFGASNFNLEDEERPGRPSSNYMINITMTSHKDVIVVMIEENPRYTVRELADALKIPQSSIHNHLTTLGYVNRSDV